MYLSPCSRANRHIALLLQGELVVPAPAILALAVGVICALAGCLMILKPAVLRHWLGRPHSRPSEEQTPGDDPVAYGLRIAGSMLFTFGMALATLFYLFSVT